MKKTKTTKKSSAKKPKAGASKKVAPKAKLTAKKKTAVKAKAVLKAKGVAKATIVPKSAVVMKPKAAPKKKARRVPATVQVGSQDVETVQVKPKARVARAGAGGGDFGGASLVEGADSESVNELLEEGQTFEAGIVRGVEEADEEVEQEVHTREVLQDDVPGEYDDDDRS